MFVTMLNPTFTVADCFCFLYHPHTLSFNLITPYSLSRSTSVILFLSYFPCEPGNGKDLGATVGAASDASKYLTMADAGLLFLGVSLLVLNPI